MSDDNGCDRDASRLPVVLPSSRTDLDRIGPILGPVLSSSSPCPLLAATCAPMKMGTERVGERREVEKRERPIYNPWSTERQVVVVALLASPCVEFNAARCDAENGMGRPWRPGQWSRSEGR